MRGLTDDKRWHFAICLTSTPDEMWERNMAYLREKGLIGWWKKYGLKNRPQVDQQDFRNWVLRREMQQVGQ